MKPIFCYIIFVVTLFTLETTAYSPVLSCTHVFDVSNNLCYISNTTKIQDDTLKTSCFIASSSPFSSSPSFSSFPFILTSSATLYGVSVSSEFTNSIHIAQSGAWTWIGKILNEKISPRTQTSNIIFGTLESASTFELAIAFLYSFY